jgi:hypothetical protein
MLGVANNGRQSISLIVAVGACKLAAIKLNINENLRQNWFIATQERRRWIYCVSIANAPTPTLFLWVVIGDFFFLMCARVKLEICFLPDAIELARFAHKMIHLDRVGGRSVDRWDFNAMPCERSSGKSRRVWMDGLTGDNRFYSCNEWLCAVCKCTILILSARLAAFSHFRTANNFQLKANSWERASMYASTNFTLLFS